MCLCALLFALLLNVWWIYDDSADTFRRAAMVVIIGVAISLAVTTQSMIFEGERGEPKY